MKHLRVKWASMFGIAGAAATGALLMAFHFWPGPALLRATWYVNFLSFDLCDRFAASMFKGEHLAPPHRQSIIFATCLIVTAGVQWFIVGLLADFLARKPRKNRSVAVQQ
jgi:hypothetical protein